MAPGRGRGRGGRGGGGGGGGGAGIKFVDESYKLAIDAKLDEFRASGELEYLFPSTLNNTERRYVHEACIKLGLSSKSRGKGEDRTLGISRKVAGKREGQVPARLGLGLAAARVLQEHFARWPADAGEEAAALSAAIPQPSQQLADFTLRDERPAPVALPVPAAVRSGRDRSAQFAHVPAARQQLPVWSLRDAILDAVEANDVTIISGSTGCGKSTQVPQFLLEAAPGATSVVCTQPRRLSAMALAERVAQENGRGPVGQLVGYSVRLERKRSAETRILYCTTGVLLRDLSHHDGALASVSHLVIDEVHERDVNSDFLLTIVRELLVQRRVAVKLLLMSATLKVDTFQAYFSNTTYPLRCGHVAVPGKMFRVHELFLEDTLARTSFVSKLVSKHRTVAQALQGLSPTDAEAAVQSELAAGRPSSPPRAPTPPAQPGQRRGSRGGAAGASAGSAALAWAALSAAAPAPAYECALCSTPFPDVTTLAIHAATCVGSGSEQILLRPSFGGASAFGGAGDADAHWPMESVWGLEPPGGLAAGEGNEADEEEEEEDAEGYSSEDSDPDASAPPAPIDISQLTGKKPSDLVDMYQYARQLIGLDDDTQLDTALVVEVLEQIEQARDDLRRMVRMSAEDLEDDSSYQFKMKGTKGAVLVFCAGWDDIAKLVETLEEHPRFGDQSKYEVLPLHSGVSPAAQREVFKRPPAGVRKIICATNIAETSVTIDDVVYVVDAGTSKTKRYDPISQVSSLLAGQVAKANAQQRAGRAGRVRPGVCFRLYSRTRYEAMLDEEVPEMQRTALEELCLQTCVLLESGRALLPAKRAGGTSSVRDFLERAPDPPRDVSVRNALLLLRELGAIDAHERLTPLGRALARLPLHPVLGKMVYYGSVLGLRQVAVTLSAFFSVGRDPFSIPQNAAEKKRFQLALDRLTGRVNSDHFAYARGFVEFEQRGFQACREFLLSPAAMDTVKRTRAQILDNIPVSVREVRFDRSTLSFLTQVEMLACLGTFPNVALLPPGTKKLIAGAEKSILPHKSSVLRLHHSDSAHAWIVFSEMTRSKRSCSIKGCTEVMPLYLALFHGVYTIERKGTKASVHLSSWIELAVDDLQQAVMLGVLRARAEDVFLRSVAPNAPPVTERDLATVATLLRMCEAEKTGQSPLESAMRPHAQPRAPPSAAYGRGRGAAPAYPGHHAPRGRGGGRGAGAGASSNAAPLGRGGAAPRGGGRGQIPRPQQPRPPQPQQPQQQQQQQQQQQRKPQLAKAPRPSPPAPA